MPFPPSTDAAPGFLSEVRRPAALASSIDLFCGAGGLSRGLQAAGLDVVAHLDNWQPAVDTLNANFSESREAVDVAALSTNDILGLVSGRPGLIAGGPPCQPFTSAGRRRAGDPRGSLVGVYARLAADVRPDLVVFENVEGFATASGGQFVFDLLDPLMAAGYWIRVRKVNLANYGVPQHRKRVIVVASLAGVPPFPSPTHSAWGTPGARHVAGRPPTPTLAEALRGLPAPAAQNAPQGHTPTRVSDVERVRISALKPGQTMRDLPEELWHESYRKRAFRRVMDGTPTERRGGAPAGLRRLRADEPSKAITSAAVREFVHPTSDRRLTLREVARLQTFPDDFEFHGRPADQATLVGNAIPPRFAEVLGRSLLAHLAATETAERHSPGEGALVEFNVTPAAQLSPALAKVVNKVRSRYLAATLFASVTTS